MSDDGWVRDLWLKTTGAEDRAWVSEDATSAFARSGWTVWAVDQQHKTFIGAFDREADANFVVAMHQWFSGQHDAEDIIPKRVADTFYLDVLKKLNEPTAEQKARDILERCGVEDAQSFTSGDVVELANLIANLIAKYEKYRSQLEAIRNQCGT